MKTKKELQEEYKNLNPVMGVFSIKNIINDKVLIDHSLDIMAKWNRHKRSFFALSNLYRGLLCYPMNIGSRNFTTKLSRQNRPDNTTNSRKNYAVYGVFRESKST